LYDNREYTMIMFDEKNYDRRNGTKMCLLYTIHVNKYI
jgi:hypothetical protein